MEAEERMELTTIAESQYKEWASWQQKGRNSGRIKKHRSGFSMFPVLENTWHNCFSLADQCLRYFKDNKNIF